MYGLGGVSDQNIYSISAVTGGKNWKPLTESKDDAMIDFAYWNGYLFGLNGTDHKVYRTTPMENKWTLFVEIPGLEEEIIQILIYDDIMYGLQRRTSSSPKANIHKASPKLGGQWLGEYIYIDIDKTDKWLSFARWNDEDGNEYSYAIFSDHNVWRIKVSIQLHLSFKKKLLLGFS